MNCFLFLSQNVTNIGPATDFYKKLSLDCSAQQIAVDLFMLNGQYADIATLCMLFIFFNSSEIEILEIVNKNILN